MNESNKISNEDLRKAFEGNTTPAPQTEKKKPKKQSTWDKKFLIMLIIGAVCAIGGIATLIVSFVLPSSVKQNNLASHKSSEETKETYSALTGEQLSDPALLEAPAYCIQTPNGLDGARPQSGLNEAGVIFEAIAEAGITRFAAIYQNPSSAVIGPIRSLRTYYLEWDTPFDCTIVHAGGSGDALAAISSGNYRDLTEDYQYMYRGTHSGRLWNNLFTTSDLLRQFNTGHNYNNSTIKGFARMTPTESAKARVDDSVANKFSITKPSEGNTSETSATVTDISLSFGSSANFNVNYTYDSTTNTYLRSYASGTPHQVYKCPGDDLGEKNPEDVCELVQMSPSVVIAMVVSERRASDNYHEDIDVIGTGTAYIFQNGTSIEGTWHKTTREDQIKFLDEKGNEIKLAPGQTFISAIPSYGSIDF